MTRITPSHIRRLKRRAKTHLKQRTAHQKVSLQISFSRLCKQYFAYKYCKLHSFLFNAEGNI